MVLAVEDVRLVLLGGAQELLGRRHRGRHLDVEVGQEPRERVAEQPPSPRR
jgi:hypothetical protein